ncbi:MAG TPA: DUF1175 family protein [Pyrinomonadaceae bacterium]|nr:DUF1175 family protein [Pyrinomonadaceae bacterium]
MLCLTLIVAAACASGCQRTTTAARADAGSPAPAERAAPPAEAALRWDDSDSDGIPDRAELRSFNDRENFRRWFTAVAETQFYRASDEWNTEQRDCAGLVRFAWREALRRHDRAWLKRMGAEYEQTAPDVRAYDLARGPLGEKLFRTAHGPFRESDLTEAVFSEFADARTLKDFNTTFVGRERSRARPGDLLFFHQPWSQKFPYHVMLFLGPAHHAGGADDDPSADDWVVYHTGAAPADGGEVRKVRLATLERHPQARWRPLAANRHFLGFYRLKILE